MKMPSTPSTPRMSSRWSRPARVSTIGSSSGWSRGPRRAARARPLPAPAGPCRPGLADAIEFREAATPLTYFRYTRNPRGAIEGYENSPENSGLGWLPQVTPIRNLFLAGARTNSGGQNPAIGSGAAAARLAMQQALAPAR